MLDDLEKGRSRLTLSVSEALELARRFNLCIGVGSGLSLVPATFVFVAFLNTPCSSSMRRASTGSGEAGVLSAG